MFFHMITLLLTVIYTAYIGLGIPHSLFGAAWPAIHTDLALAMDSANYITVLISGSTVVASILGAKLSNRFGVYAVVAVSTCTAAATLLGFSLSESLLAMCLLSIPLGLASGAIDVSLNNFIAVNYSAMHINFLHCFYGVGIMLSPYIMSVMLNSTGWRTGYFSIFLIQSAIALIIIFSKPLWKNARVTQLCEEREEKTKNLSYFKMLKNPSIILIWFLCISANAIEGAGGIWGSTFLVYTHNFTEANAAKTITLFYIGMALSRFLSGILSIKLSSRKLIATGTVIMLLSVILMLTPYKWAVISGIFLLGLGNGPVHPNVIHLTPKYFGKSHSGEIVSSEMAMAYLGITIGPPIFGFLANSITTALFPVYIGGWILMFALSLYFFFKKVQKTSKICYTGEKP